MPRNLLLSASLALTAGLPATSSLAAQFQLERAADGVAVRLDGQLFTRYLVKSGRQPILWPIIGPSGKPLTRGYPMQPLGPHEKSDHVHHRSLWFNHGDVNGISFWHDEAQSGSIVHRQFVELTSGTRGVLVARNDWLGPHGKKVCADQRRWTFSAGDDWRAIDLDVTLIADDQAVVLGDTKEGSLGVRVAGSITVDSGLGGKIVNSHGQTDGKAWGQRADWVDYHGPVDGQTVGIAILNHPSSFRYPACWHVRTYGLFAANPFGRQDFTSGREEDGSHRLQPGETLTLRFRVLLHLGDEREGRVADHFASYQQQVPDRDE